MQNLKINKKDIFSLKKEIENNLYNNISLLIENPYDDINLYKNIDKKFDTLEKLYNILNINFDKIRYINYIAYSTDKLDPSPLIKILNSKIYY